MRVGGSLLLVVVIAVAVVMLLGRADVERTSVGVDAIAERLHEEGVVGRPFDLVAARAAATTLRALLDEPDSIRTRSDELDGIIARAAAWAEEAPAPSSALRAAVALRCAAVELQGWPTDRSPSRLDRARRHLDRASAALDGSGSPLTLTDGVRDRLRNLEQAQRERYQRLDEGLE